MSHSMNIYAYAVYIRNGIQFAINLIDAVGNVTDIWLMPEIVLLFPEVDLAYRKSLNKPANQQTQPQTTHTHTHAHTPALSGFGVRQMTGKVTVTIKTFEWFHRDRLLLWLLLLLLLLCLAFNIEFNHHLPCKFPSLCLCDNLTSFASWENYSESKFLVNFQLCNFIPLSTDGGGGAVEAAQCSLHWGKMK